MRRSSVGSGRSSDGVIGVDRPAGSPWCRRTSAASARTARSGRRATAAARGGVSTTGATPSGLAPGSDVKFSGDGVLPYSPQPIPMPSSTSTAGDRSADAPTAAGAATRASRDLQRGQLHRRVVGLQVGDQRLQITERRGVRRGGHPLAVFLHRQLPVGQRAVEHLAGVVAVAVLGPGACCLPRRHGDDRKSSASHHRRPMAKLPAPTRSLARRASALRAPTYSGHRAIAATGGGLRASAPVPAGRGVLRAAPVSPRSATPIPICCAPRSFTASRVR